MKKFSLFFFLFLSLTPVSLFAQDAPLVLLRPLIVEDGAGVTQAQAEQIQSAVYQGLSDVFDEDVFRAEFLADGDYFSGADFTAPDVRQNALALVSAAAQVQGTARRTESGYFCLVLMFMRLPDLKSAFALAHGKDINELLLQVPVLCRELYDKKNIYDLED